MEKLMIDNNTSHNKFNKQQVPMKMKENRKY